MSGKSDGSIQFDTTIDYSGIQKGLKTIQQSVQDYSKTAIRDFEKVDDTLNTSIRQHEKLDDALAANVKEIEKVSKQYDNLDGQIRVEQKLLEELCEKYDRVALAKGKDSEAALKLEKQILQTEKRIDSMKNTMDGLDEKLVSLDQTEEKIVKAMADLEKESLQAADSLETLSDQSKSAGSRLDETASVSGNAASTFEKAGEKAQSASRNIEKMSDQVKGLSGGFQSSLSSISEFQIGIGAFSTTIGSLTSGAIQGLTSEIGKLVDGGKEFNGAMGLLKTNAEAAGVSVDIVEQSMAQLAIVCDDTDERVETLSNLLAADFGDSNMAAIVELLSDAVLKFPDTLRIESLADSLQETLATSQATGQFAELLERVGIDLDRFNEGLERASRKGREQQYVIDTLAKTGVKGLTDSYIENNRASVMTTMSWESMKKSTGDLTKGFEGTISVVKALIAIKYDQTVSAVKRLTDSLSEAVKGIIELFKFDKKELTIKTNYTVSGSAPNHSGYAAGTSSAVPGWHLVGEEGPELVYFGGGEAVLPAGRTRAYLSEPLGMYGGSPVLSAYANQSSLADCAQRILDGFQSQVKAMTTNVRNVSSQTTYNIFKVDDIQTYQRIMERLEFEQQSERMGYTGGF